MKCVFTFDKFLQVLQHNKNADLMCLYLGCKEQRDIILQICKSYLTILGPLIFHTTTLT